LYHIFLLYSYKLEKNKTIKAGEYPKAIISNNLVQ